MMDKQDQRKYESLSVEQLNAEIQTLREQERTLHDQAREIDAIRNEKLVGEKAAALVAAMSDPEKVALAQAVRVAGVEGGESVGQLST